MSPRASIVIPTRDRPEYLQVALSSIVAQALAHDAEVLVIDDAGATPEVRELAERFGVRYLDHGEPRGLNVARNSGVRHSTGELVVFVDDDVQVTDGWLRALLDASMKRPEVQVFTGPIYPRLEGNPPRSCGREGPPITTLDLGETDTYTSYAWGANMTIRRGALELVGPFDVSLQNGGDEQEWQDRLFRNKPGEVLYVAGAAVYHRRAPTDSRLSSLLRSAAARGGGARRFDVWRGKQPSSMSELSTLLRCVGHVLRYRCPAGLVMAAHSYGRLREALVPRPTGAAASDETPADDDFLSGSSGTVGGLDGVRRGIVDELAQTIDLVSLRRTRLAFAARTEPSLKHVLVLGVQRPRLQATTSTITAELQRSRHAVEMRFCQPGDRGKFENLDRLLESNPADRYDWLLVIDDDVVLPAGFLDRFLFLAERFSLDLAQPAHRARSHAAWEVTRRRPAVVARETGFVEIGPVTGFSGRTFSTLLPFPQLRMGWGLDLHWGALAREHGWRCGVLDALAVSHLAAPAASTYSRQQAIAEARSFLSTRPYLTAREAQRTLATHRRW